MKVLGCQIAGLAKPGFAPFALVLTCVALVASCSKKDSKSASTPDPEPQPVVEDPVVPDAPDPVVPDPGPKKPAVPERFENASDVASAVAEQLKAGEIGTVRKMIGEAALADPSAFGFEWLFDGGDYKIDSENPVTDIGEIQDVKRYAINIVSTKDPDAKMKVFLDMTADGKSGWSVDSVKVPPALQSLARAAGVEPPAKLPIVEGSKPEPSAITKVPLEDSLMKAENFLTSVLSLDYGKAVAMCDPVKVPEEKIAALCIVFEEGRYRMKKVKPLMATAIGDDAAWVIAKVESEKLETKSEFGLEMVLEPEKGWKIVGLNFSKMLAEYAKVSDAGKVPYTPIIKNPKGGESLVLYFEYDDASVVNRAQRQLDIVAGIL